MVLTPLISFVSSYFLGYFIQSHRFISHLFTDYSQFYLKIQHLSSGPDLYIQLPTQHFYMDNRHTRFNMSKCKFLIPLPHVSSSLCQLTATHPSSCSGQVTQLSLTSLSFCLSHLIHQQILFFSILKLYAESSQL